MTFQILVQINENFQFLVCFAKPGQKITWSDSKFPIGCSFNECQQSYGRCVREVVMMRRGERWWCWWEGKRWRDSTDDLTDPLQYTNGVMGLIVYFVRYRSGEFWFFVVVLVVDNRFCLYIGLKYIGAGHYLAFF